MIPFTRARDRGHSEPPHRSVAAFLKPSSFSHSDNRSHIGPVVRSPKPPRIKARYRPVEIQSLAAAEQVAKVHGKLMESHRRLTNDKHRGVRGRRADAVPDTPRL